MPIKGKIALVLGAVKGIGKEIGLALAKEGATLVLTRYDWEEEFRQMEEDFAAANGEHMILTVDLRSIQDIERLSTAIEKKIWALGYSYQ